MPIYTPTNPWQSGQPAPSILAIGDSWFWYPNSNMLEAVLAHPKFNPAYAGIQRFGYNGAHIADYVGKGLYAKDFAAELASTWAPAYSAFFISGGGNDAVCYPDREAGPEHLGLRDDCSGIADPLDCFDAGRLDDLLKVISGAMGTLIHDILWAVQRDFQSGKRLNDVDIFLHGYDHPVPDGRGFGGGELELAGPWLAKWMNAAKVEDELAYRTALCVALIDRLNETLASFDGQGNDRVHFIDARGALSTQLVGDQYRRDWANELHPTPDGFAKVADRKWIPVLKRYKYTV
jgi:hypothetical protein